MRCILARLAERAPSNDVRYTHQVAFYLGTIHNRVRVRKDAPEKKRTHRRKKGRTGGKRTPHRVRVRA